MRLVKGIYKSSTDYFFHFWRLCGFHETSRFSTHLVLALSEFRSAQGWARLGRVLGEQEGRMVVGKGRARVWDCCQLGGDSVLSCIKLVVSFNEALLATVFLSSWKSARPDHTARVIQWLLSLNGRRPVVRNLIWKILESSRHSNTLHRIIVKRAHHAACREHRLVQLYFLPGLFLFGRK